MQKTLVSLILIIFCCYWTVEGQVDTVFNKRLPQKLERPNKVKVPALDSIPADSIPNIAPTPTSAVSISDNAIDDEVEYGAKDSILYDNYNNRVHLYGEAFVKFQAVELKAGYITISLDSSIAVAQTTIDGSGIGGSPPNFTDGSQNFQASKMRYNFKSNKGIVYDVATTQSNLFLKGQKTKFVSQQGESNDTTAVDNILYNRNAIFSTCDAPHPHYGIRSRKQKVVADKVVVVGLSNLELAGVPTPVYLPFGFFPLKQYKSTGLIFPDGYEYSPQWGFGLEGIGWYFPISEKLDLRLTSEIYWHGTWGLTADSRYKKRYKYSGNLAVSYSSRKSLDIAGRQNSYSIRWSHRQDTKAHPTRSFSGNVNIQGNGFQRVNNNDAQSVLQGTLSSNVSFNQTFPGRPYRLSAAMSHSQNTQTNKVNINFPTVNFQLNRIYPFKQDRGGNKEKWYEKISFKYDGQFQNKFTATDTTLFSQKTIDDARFGFKHNASTDLNFNLLKYVTVSPNASFNEVWYFHTTQTNGQEDLPDTFEARDTVFGFKPWHQFSTGVSMNTNLFGTLQFKKGRLKGVRHTVKPSISFNYTPDYGAPEGFFGGLFDEYDRDTSDAVTLQRYSIFEGGIFGSPSTNSSGKQMAINYSINNIFEAKFRPKRDSVDKKIKLFDNIRVGGNYNFAADSLKFSDVSATGTTRLFKGITTLNANARWTPYTADTNNLKINQFYTKTHGKLLRFTNADFRLSSRVSVRDIKKFFQKETTATNTSSRNNNERGGQDNRGQNNQVDNGFLKFLEGFNLNHTLAITATQEIDQPTSWEIRTHSINVTIANIQLTEKWSMQIGNIGYDFKNDRTTYPDIGIFRDLHCWETSFRWQPQRGTYFFTIKVKNAPLDMLKLPYQKNNVDAFGGF